MTVGHLRPHGTGRALFHRYCDTYTPDTRTFNTLMLGFKDASHGQALDLFYHDDVLCGFVPDAVLYCMRMDAYCEKGRFSNALQLLDEMHSSNDGRGDRVQQHR
jgi:pentatricopeptide repeat protein